MEQRFEKDGVVRYVYHEADAVRLRGQGWREVEPTHGKAEADPVAEEPTEEEPKKAKGRDS